MDLLRRPVIGPFLRWRHARTAMQVPLFLVAVLIVFDGLAGPQLAPKNLATVGVWLHYRGFVVLALLLAGNLFCMACPFMLPRQAARWLRRRLWNGGRMMPAALRGKWLAIGLVVLFFFSYEHFDLWATPRWTAWLAVGYFAAALAVDALFRGAAFCKYVCPLGQFNFFGSLISPLEIRVRRQSVCAGCRTKDCITAGQETALPVVTGRRGCELWLFQQRKAGNMDCTFCLDCVHACPHDNVGLITRMPSAELWTDPFRSGVGRFSKRTDLAVLVVVFTFGAYLNAFAMIRPVYVLQGALARGLGTTSTAPGLVLIFAFGLVILPGTLLALSGLATRVLDSSGRAVRPVVLRYVYALAPMGFGMWLAHYTFHFLTGALTIVPVAQAFLADVGLYAGEPAWGLGPVVPAGWLFPIEAALLYSGAFGSIIAALQIARHDLSARTAGHSGRPRREPQPGPSAVLAAAAPWVFLTLLLLGFGLWILLQPMEMRGTMQISLPGS